MKPVAWMQTFEDGEDKRMSLDFERIGINDIPLYTAPQTKPLSDDEIIDICDEHTDYDGNFITDIDTFVRAIEKAHGIK